MVIFCNSYRRVKSTTSGYEFLFIYKRNIFRFPNSFLEEAEFDIFSPNEWRKFLREFIDENGQRLPRYSDIGDRLVYGVYLLGTPTWIRDSYGLYNFNLYPGYNEKKKEEEGILERIHTREGVI